jgi:hypothetical protein
MSLKQRTIPLIFETLLVLSLLWILGAACPPLTIAFLFVLFLAFLGGGSIPEGEESPGIEEKEIPKQKQEESPGNLVLIRNMYREWRKKAKRG